MSSQPNVQHAGNMLANLKKMHQDKIEELYRMIESLQEEIRIIKAFDERLDDL